MIKLTNETLKNAIARARTLRPLVKVLSVAHRLYAVESKTHAGTVYHVRFDVQKGEKLAECRNSNGQPCPANKHGLVCYHVSAAAAVNIACQSMRRTVAA